MNAIELLKQDHQIVDGLFKQVESTPPSAHPPLFKRIKGELDTHAHAEEVIFYPELKKRGDKELKKIVLEGIEEHEQMKMFLAGIAALNPRNERFEPKLKVLIEDTRHHVKEEEGVGGMFSMAEDQLGEEAMEKLGKRIEAEKAKFQAANKIKPEPREQAASALGTLVEKAKGVMADILGTGDTRPKTDKRPAKAKANGRSGDKKSTTVARSQKATGSKPAAGKSAKRSAAKA